MSGKPGPIIRIILRCQTCGDAFTRTRNQAHDYIHGGWRRYCSPACANRQRPPTIRMILTCRQCGQDFAKPLHDARDKRVGGWLRHCSVLCAQRARDPNTRRGNTTPRRGSTRTLVCVTCGHAFTRPASTPIPAQPHCSNACRKPDLPDWREQRSSAHQCSVCGTVFMVKPHQLRDSQRLCCSPKCAGIAKQSRTLHTCRWCKRTFSYYRGSQRFYCGRPCYVAHRNAVPTINPSFKGGPFPHYGPNWPAQRRAARDRDNHTCQRCGLYQRRPRLHVHHIQPRRTFGNDYLAGNALTNLVTLCKSCHRHVERRGWATAV